MKGKLIINGKELEVEIDNTTLDAITRKCRTGYERVAHNEVHYFADTMDEHMDGVDSDSDDYGRTDDTMYENADYYSDESVARNNARADTLMRRLRRYAAEHGGIPNCDHWNDKELAKYTIEYIHATKILGCFMNICFQNCLSVYFLSEDACKKAIELFYDDLLWYFTEYQPMLYEEV